MLYADFINNTGRPVHKMMHYFAAYQRHFKHLVDRPCRLLEIGVGNGGSSQMWKKWLGPLAHIVCIDINEKCLQFQDEQVVIVIGDQSDPAFLQSLIDRFGTFDAVLDDGSHHMQHVMASFNYLYPRIAHNGVYMVEDVHTAYWPDWGGGYKNSASIVEFFKETVDQLNAAHIRDSAFKQEDIGTKTYCISAYDSILVFEKTSFANRANLMLGDETKRVIY